FAFPPSAVVRLRQSDQGSCKSRRAKWLAPRPWRVARARFMPIAIQEFWKLSVASGLLSPARCRELHAEYKSLKGAAQHADARSLAQWLAASGVLTRYQASQLAAGRSGPFVFGDYTITERIDS